MDILRTDEEQVQVLKKWWERYGKSVLTGIVLCLVLVTAWRVWTDHRQKNAELASDALADLLEASQKAQQPDADELARSTLETLGEPLLQEYGSSYYGQLATLVMAKHAAVSGQLEQAALYLQSVLEQAEDEALERVVQLRLAKVYLDLKQYGQALKVLEVDLARTDVSYAAFEELKGDIRFAQQELAQAKQHYKNAQASVATKRPFLEMKLDNLKE